MIGRQSAVTTATGCPGVVVTITSARPTDPPPTARATVAPWTCRANATGPTSAPASGSAVVASTSKGTLDGGVVGQCRVVLACGSPAAVSASTVRWVGG